MCLWEWILQVDSILLAQKLVVVAVVYSTHLVEGHLVFVVKRVHRVVVFHGTNRLGEFRSVTDSVGGG